MMPFFRRIRKQLADDNKPLKYVRYAIGEIVLVVIGILIALSINNWNEERKDIILERYYLESLIKELEINIQTAILDKEFNEFQYNNSKLILAACNHKFDGNSEALAVAIEHTGWIRAPSFVRNVWNELYSTGNIRIIRNNKIKDILTTLYDDASMQEIYEKEWGQYNLGYRRLVSDVLPASLRLAILDDLKHEGYTGKLNNSIDGNQIIERLNQIDGLKGYLVDIISNRKARMGQKSTNIKACESIISSIKADLLQ